jgi:hypothetical protein
VWARHAAGTGPKAPWSAHPRDHASPNAKAGGAAQHGARGGTVGVSPSRRRGATIVNPTSPI